MKIRIIAIPAGEAPLWVRKAWVGLELEVEVYRGSTKGVVTGYPSADSVKGYAVRFEIALHALLHYNAQASAWWHQNNQTKHRPDRMLIFKPEDCQVLLPEIQIAQPQPEEWWG